MTDTVDRSQLTTIIAGLMEGVILIEPDQRIAWANDAALAMHGVETVAGLGTDVSDYRSRFSLRYRNNHLLADGFYPIERVIAGEVFDDVVVEVAPARNPGIHWVHRIRSLVLKDRDGLPDCLVLVLTDATERFAAEERFEKTFAANPAPAVICRLGDLRFVKVNQGFVDMTGYAREEVLGRTTYEIDLFHEARQRATAIERLSEGRTVPQMESCLPLPDGTTKFVIVAGQPIDMGGEPCMLFTFADLEPRRKAETALQHSEERFAKAFRLSPVPTILLRLDDLKTLAVNEAFTSDFGFAEAHALGRSMPELMLWVRPEHQDAFRATLAETGHVRNFEASLYRRDGVRTPLPAVVRTRDDQRRSLRALGAARHHGAQAHRAGPDGRHRIRHGRHVVVQPRRHRAPGGPPPHGSGRSRPGRRLLGTRTPGARPDVRRPHRCRHRQAPVALDQHRAQPRGVALPQARPASPQRRRDLGARAGFSVDDAGPNGRLTPPSGSGRSGDRSDGLRPDQCTCTTILTPRYHCRGRRERHFSSRPAIVGDRRCRAMAINPWQGAPGQAERAVDRT